MTPFNRDLEISMLLEQKEREREAQKQKGG